jgi:hypothetical protein
MITADQLVAHAVGDYILQSDWMATEKTKQNTAAAAHAITYTLPFLFLTRSPAALAVICGTHFVIDRWRLARYVVWAKNLLCPYWRLWGADMTWEACKGTGYSPDRPPWMAVWLLIIADNILHVLINGIALRFL